MKIKQAKQCDTDEQAPLSTPEYFLATAGRRRRVKFNRDLYEAGTLLKKLGFFDGDEDWCARVQEATTRLETDVRLAAWMQIGKALLMAMNLDGYEEVASGALEEWIEWWREETNGR